MPAVSTKMDRRICRATAAVWKLFICELAVTIANVTRCLLFQGFSNLETRSTFPGLVAFGNSGGCDDARR